MILNSPYISGSLTVTGNTTIQGQLTVTGSLSGTASLASNALLLQGTGSTGFATTASVLQVSSSQQEISSSLLQVSASYTALSGSYNTFSGSNSTILTAVSSSQQQISASLLNVIAIGATTGSNSFRADQSITGSLVVSSTITAQTLVVQTVTSSIVYSSGSNIFGSALTDRQSFTGSVLVTGSLTIAAGGNVSAPTIYGSTIICSPVGKYTTCLTFGDWTTAENVLTSNKPNEQGAYIRAAVSNASSPTYTFEDDRDTGMYRDSANSLAFATSGSSRIQISATGDSLFNGAITIQGACSSRICLIKAYSGSPSNPGFVITDTNGVLTFNHNANGGGTSISGVTCIGSNFCVAGASYFAGVIGLGITSPSANLDINATGGLGGWTGIRLKTGTSSVQSLSMGQVTAGNGAFIGMAQYNQGGYWQTEGTAAAVLNFEGDGTFRISTNSGLTANTNYNITERLRISNTGLVGIGTTSPAYNLHICCSGQVINNIQVNSTTAGSEAGILITTPDSIGLLTVGASASRGLTDAARCDMVMGLRTGGKIRFSTDVNANTTHVSIANGITSFACQMCAPYAIFSGTAAITLPVGTTAQRPGPSTGMIRFNSSCTELEYYNGNDWLFFTATPQSQGYYADVLVIGGGGGGGGAEASNGYGGGGAGGGAGGYMAGRIFINYTNCGYPISIGGGGTGGANEGQSTGSGCNGTMGTASCALGLIAIGGGFGAGDETQTGGGNGGSGGGNGGDNTGTQGCGTLGQGCAGGYANTRLGGGGGGASTTGCHGYGGSGAGGQGRAWYNGTTYAGGGGGGAGSAVTSTQSGGAGGGGCGSSTNGTSGAFQAGGTATVGTANTGGGGGAGAAGRAQGGQNGGSGIVIVRYYGSQKGFGGTVTSSGGYTYHSFTTSGTYCATYY